MIPKPYKSKLEAIVNKTYHAHALGTQLFGLWPDSEKCSYELGCAIGISLPKDLGERLDQGGISAITSLLTSEWEVAQQLRTELFGSKSTKKDIPAAVISCLGDLQSYHDTCAIEGQDRVRYARKIERLAQKYHLTLSRPPHQQRGARGAAAENTR